MKSLLYSICLIIQCILSSVYAQQGKLYINYPSQLSYISIPDGQITPFDSVDVSAFAHDSTNLYVATGSSSLSGGYVFKYDFSTHMRDTVPIGSDIYNLIVEDDKLLALHKSPPHLRVYDIMAGYSLIFQIDTPDIATLPYTMRLAPQDELFLLVGQDLVWVDLNQQNVKNTYAIEPPVFMGQHFPKLLLTVPGRDEIYIYMDYATGMIRSSMLSFDPATEQFDTTYHLEGFAEQGFPPVATKDKIYLYSINSYYDLATDTAIASHDPSTPIFPISYDSISDVLFLYQTSIPDIYWEKDSQFTNVSLPDFLRPYVLYVSEEKTDAIDPLALSVAGMSVFPVPAHNQLNIDFKRPVQINEIKLINTLGSQVSVWRETANILHWQGKLPPLPAGVYYIQLKTRKGTISRKILLE